MRWWTIAVAVGLCAGGLDARPAAGADRRTEAAALDALKKAAGDYLATNYTAAARRLERAARACGAKRCSPRTRATVLRDLGTMQFRNGDVAAARRTWTEALKLAPDLAPNPDYDAPDLRAAWDEARTATAGTAGAAGTAASAGKPESTSGQPTGDFTHTPAAEQKANTPLPIYAELEGPHLARVIVKYRGAAAKEWSRVELKPMGSGWGGMIPCGEVTVGTLHYWLQGFDESGEPAANSGDLKHPYTVAVKDEITGEAPHLPGKSPPKTCGDTDCPPGLPGCAPEKEKDEGNEREREPTEGEAPAAASTEYARLWFGVSAELPELLSMPAGQDLCKLTSAGLPANSLVAYCTNPDGSDFPTRANPMQNDQLVPGRSGRIDGGLHTGDVRVMAAFDYALSANLLVGGRFGYVLSAYTGQAAVNAGRALGPKIHAEGRVTYVLGSAPLTKVGFAPMGFLGAGVSEFDGSVTSAVSQANVAGQQPVNVWITDGPFFVAAGAGVRYQFSVRAAFTFAARANAVIGGNGFLMTYGPEVGVLYGF
jgi:hypothetical protein